MSQTYYQRHKTRLKARAAERHAEKRSEILVKQRAYAKRNVKRATERKRAWRAANRDRYNASCRKAYAEKPSVQANIKAHTAKYRAALRQARCACCTDAQIRKVYAVAALIPLEVDHRVPLALGGAHCCRNFQLLTQAEHAEKTRNDLRLIAAVRWLV